MEIITVCCPWSITTCMILTRVSRQSSKVVLETPTFFCFWYITTSYIQYILLFLFSFFFESKKSREKTQPNERQPGEGKSEISNGVRIKYVLVVTVWHSGARNSKSTIILKKQNPLAEARCREYSYGTWLNDIRQEVFQFIPVKQHTIEIYILLILEKPNIYGFCPPGRSIASH